MEKIAFKMQLKPGCEVEYKKRHDEIWPELRTLLTNAGIRDYSIHLDTQTNCLFAVLWRNSNHQMDELPGQPLMQRWWDHMADIMDTGLNNEPTVTPLKTVFYMS